LFYKKTILKHINKRRALLSCIALSKSIKGRFYISPKNLKLLILLPTFLVRICASCEAFPSFPSGGCVRLSLLRLRSLLLRLRSPSCRAGLDWVTRPPALPPRRGKGGEKAPAGSVVEKRSKAGKETSLVAKGIEVWLHLEFKKKFGKQHMDCLLLFK
jgi:hypothetical protein